MKQVCLPKCYTRPRSTVQSKRPTEETWDSCWQVANTGVIGRVCQLPVVLHFLRLHQNRQNEAFWTVWTWQVLLPES